MGQIRQNAEAETEIGPPSSDRALYSYKARSFNQSERALYRNFIINFFALDTGVMTKPKRRAINLS